MPEFRTFTTQAEREQWLIENAEYFTVIYRRQLHNHRLEFKTLPEADYAAYRIADELRISTLIYAISGVNDTYVKGWVAPTKEGEHAHLRRDPSLSRNRKLHR